MKPTVKPTTEPDKPDVLLLAKLTVSSSSRRALDLTWIRLDEADGYDVYFVKCGHDMRYRATAFGSGSCSYRFKDLKKGVAYKGYVRAWKWVNGKKTFIAESPYVHAVVNGYNSSWCNVRSVNLNRSSLVLKTGKSKHLKATVTLVKKGREALQHDKLVRYYSSNTNVATVDGDGNVKAVGKGRCTIYALAINGVRAKVKVTVK